MSKQFGRLILFGALLCGVAQARPVPDWPLDVLHQKADVVVLAVTP